VGAGVITDRFVLPPGVEVVPVGELTAELRARFTHRPGDYVISRGSGRAGTHVVDASSAGLLERFRAGTTISDAVIAFSRGADADPERVLSDVWPVLQKLIDARLLVPEHAAGSVEVAPTLAVGARIDEWTAVHCVYLLEDTELWQVRDGAGRSHALKLARMARDSVVVARFRREAEMLASLGGSVGPRLSGRGTLGDAAYLVLEWCPGADVETVAAEYRTWPVGDGRSALLRLALGVVDAYVSLHAAGVLHSDVHPKNLLVDRDGRVTILDFAFARRMGGDDPVPRGGVPFYYEPELAVAVRSGAEVPASTALGEQFAIAAVVYRLLAGTHYREFPLDRDAFWRAIAEEAPLPFADAWPTVETVLRRALAKNPADRYPSVAAFGAALRGVGDSAFAPTREIPSLGEVGRGVTTGLIEWAADHASLNAQKMASVMNGTAGVAYMLYRVALGRADAGLLALADLWAEQARVDAARPEQLYREEWKLTPDRCAVVSPYHMISGVHAVRALIAHAAGDEPALTGAVRDFIEASATTDIDLDLTLGSAGILLVSAMLVDAIHGERRSPLLAHGARAYAALCQTLEAAAMSTTVSASGVAHGWAGALYAGLRWCVASGCAPAPVIGRRLSELAAHGEPHGRGVRWPWMLDGGSRSTYTPGWCNGTAGMVSLWTVAARVMRDPVFDELADRSAWHTWESGGGGADLCCGNAGAAYALLARYQTTGDVAWLRRATSRAERAVRAMRRGLPSEAVGRDSLFHGDIGLALLVAELDWPTDACMPFFGHEGWPMLAGAERSGGY
jgi:eukaryotic-like serine/threonine-protein kinase